MKHTVRSFAVGLLTTGLVMLAVFYFIDDSNNNQSNISTDEMISHIEQEGYRVLTEKEYISYSVASSNQNNGNKEEVEEQATEEAPAEETASADEDETAAVNSKASKKDAADKKDKTKDKEKEEKDQAEEKEKEEEKEKSKPVTKTINIPSGMASSQISSLLEDENLIDDASAFNAYLQENDYSLRVQIGKHELREGMSFYQIAEALTN